MASHVKKSFDAHIKLKEDGLIRRGTSGALVMQYINGSDENTTNSNHDRVDVKEIDECQWNR